MSTLATTAAVAEVTQIWDPPVRPIPEPGPMAPFAPPPVHETATDAGLNIWAVQVPGPARFALRLWVPNSGHGGGPLRALRRALADALFTKAAGPNGAAAGNGLPGLGLDIGQAASPGGLLIRLSGLTASLGEGLELVQRALAEQSFDVAELAPRLARLGSQAEAELVHPYSFVHDVLRHHLYGNHPAGRTTLSPPDIAGVSPSGLEELAASWLRPRGSTVCVVSELLAEESADLVRRGLTGWTALGATEGPSSTSPAPPTGRLIVLDRPGAPQATFMGVLQASGFTDAGRAPLEVAVGILSRRLAHNIRHRNSFSYSVGAQLMDQAGRTHIMAMASVRTEVAAAALLEMRYEIARLAAVGPTEEEVAAARTSQQGQQAMGFSSRGSLSQYLMRLVELGLSSDHLGTHLEALGAVDQGSVVAAARSGLALPKWQMATVANGAEVEATLEALGPVEVIPEAEAWTRLDG